MKRPCYYLDDTSFLDSSVPDNSGMVIKSVKIVNNELNRKLSVEFERRLKKLYISIETYRLTGNYGSLFPCLFSCVSYVWSHHDDGRVYAEASVKK